MYIGLYREGQNFKQSETATLSQLSRSAYIHLFFIFYFVLNQIIHTMRWLKLPYDTMEDSGYHQYTTQLEYCLYITLVNY